MFNNLFRSKKGFNDMVIIASIIAVFLLSSILLPFVADAFGTEVSEYDIDNYKSEIEIETKDTASISGFTVLLNVMKLAFYDPGNTLALPFWLDMVYTLLAVVMILTISRNLWVGGGG